MKKWIILAGVILILGGYLALSFYAVKFVQPLLEKEMGPGFIVTEMRAKTTHLSVRGIQYEDPDSKRRFLQIEEIRIYPSLLSLQKNFLKIKEVTIVRPFFFFYRSREGVVAGPWGTMEKDHEEEPGEKRPKGNDQLPGKIEKERGESISIQIDRIRIQRGTIDFEDRKVGGAPAKMRLKDLDFKIENIQYPFVKHPAPVDLKGKVEGEKQEGRIDVKGWVDLKTMDLETSLKIQEVEVKTFQPYYRKKVSAKIESGTMQMESRINLKERKLNAPGELNFSNLHIQEGGGTVFWVPAGILASLLDKRGNQLKVPFHIKGNLEDSRFNVQEAFLTQIAFSLTEALGLPVKSVDGGIGGTEKGMETLVEGIKSIEEMFKKKKEKKR